MAIPLLADWQLLSSGRDQETLDNFVKALARVAPHHQGLTILGPADARLKFAEATSTAFPNTV